jgi:LPS export ABC transporter permease LptG
MRWLDPIRSVANAVWRWLRTVPNLGAWAAFTAVGLVLLLQFMGYHEKYMPWMPADGVELSSVKGWPQPSPMLLGLNYLMPYLKMWALAAGVVYHIILLRALPQVERLVVPTWIACGFLALWAITNEIQDKLIYNQITVLGEPSSMPAYLVKLAMVVLICFFPAVALSYYASRMIMERYVLRSLLQPLIFCFIGFCSLWIIFDLMDSLKDFQEAKTPTGSIIAFYLNLVPYVFVFVAPACMLLSILYTLTKMSRANEIISMLGSGRSIGQILRPVFLVAAAASLVSMAANYHWAPRAEGNREAIMRAYQQGQKGGSIMASSLMFKADDGKRTWYIGTFPFSLREDKMKSVEVRQEDESGRLVKAWHAPTVLWWQDGRWSFYGCLEVGYANGNPVEVKRWGQDGLPTRLDVTDWPETPWTIVSSSLLPDYMSVDELVSYLKAHHDLPPEKLAPFKTHLWHRFALPWQCLVLALVAAPLGIAFSRRGVLGGIAGAVFIFFALMFVNNLFLSLGKGLHLPASFTVWVPHLIIGAIGSVLFYYRSRNRDIPTLKISALWSWMFPKRKAA